METPSLLRQLVSIPSPFPYEKRIADFLSNYLAMRDFHIQKVITSRNRYNIVATLGTSRQYLGFYGHMDTVVRETNSPYSMEIRGSRAYGLGVADMKGGISAILQAATFASEKGIPLKVIFGVDEENISEGAHSLVDSGYLKDVAFLIVAESGQARGLKQSFSVCYGRKGRVLLDATISGKAAHAAESEQGVNAIEKAAEFIQLLRTYRFPPHKTLGKSRIVVQIINGESNAFSVPGTCHLSFSLLTSPNTKSDLFINDIVVKAKRYGIHVQIKPYNRKTPYNESYEVIQHPFLKALEKQIFTPHRVQPGYAISVADENVFANRLNIPVITVGPIGGGDHTEHEWLSLSSLKMIEHVYREIILLYHT